MSEQTSGKPGPSVTGAVQEVQGVFPSDAAMQGAVAKLTLAGFDHAELSLPATNPPAGKATPDLGAGDVLTDTDIRQTRTMGTSMAGTAGAFAAAGATIATGGAAALAVAAAAAIGAGSALAANAVGNAADKAAHDERNAAAAAGELVLAVHAATPERQANATRIMQESGATKVATVTRSSEPQPVGLDSTAWTG